MESLKYTTEHLINVFIVIATATATVGASEVTSTSAADSSSGDSFAGTTGNPADSLSPFSTQC